MPKSSFEMDLRSSSHVWRSLRSRRAVPPVPDGQPERAATFRASLEQAEQQIRAAASVDYDSGALNLFYGLSQAGRAIAAAAPMLSVDEWRLKGHGITVKNLESFGDDLADVALATQGNGSSSFRRLSAVLGSPQPAGVTLGEIWPNL